MKKTIFTISILLLSFSAFAQLYKCTENGKTAFSDQPCGKNAVTIKKDPNSEIRKRTKRNRTPTEEKWCEKQLRQILRVNYGQPDQSFVENLNKDRVLEIERTHGSCAAYFDSF